MLSREEVRQACAKTWKETSNTGSENWFDRLTDAIMALLPSDEALGEAARLLVVDAIGRYDCDDAVIGTAILEELRKQRAENPPGS